MKIKKVSVACIGSVFLIVGCSSAKVLSQNQPVGRTLAGGTPCSQEITRDSNGNLVEGLDVSSYLTTPSSEVLSVAAETPSTYYTYFTTYQGTARLYACDKASGSFTSLLHQASISCADIRKAVPATATLYCN